MIIILDTEKAFYKIQHPVIIKMCSKQEMEGNLFNLIKPTTNITLSGEIQVLTTFCIIFLYHLTVILMSNITPGIA